MLEPEPAMSTARAMALLRDGEIELEALIPWSSNSTLLVTVADHGVKARAVYKPVRGERPLYDFPRGTLGNREVAAFVVSEALGWRLVPPTVLRDGPLGSGALQLFVAHDPDVHYLAMDAPDPHVTRRIAAFDIVINNADRKSGHVLADEAGRLWAIDHGVSFHVEPKLRTVIWDFVGEPVPPDILADVAALSRRLRDREDALVGQLESLLAVAEVSAAALRAAELAAAGRFPDADPRRREFPWPPV